MLKAIWVCVARVLHLCRVRVPRVADLHLVRVRRRAPRLARLQRPVEKEQCNPYA